MYAEWNTDVARPTKVKSGRLRPVPNLINTTHFVPGRKFRENTIVELNFLFGKYINIIFRQNQIQVYTSFGEINKCFDGSTRSLIYSYYMYLINNETKIAVLPITPDDQTQV